MNLLHVKYKSETGKSAIIGIGSDWLVIDELKRDVEVYRLDDLREVAIDADQGDFYDIGYVRWLEEAITKFEKL